MTLNPWLAEKVDEYRSRHSDEGLRRDYEKHSRQGGSLTWEQYHITRALYEALCRDPFLQTIRMEMDLPEDTRDRLYRFHVDCVADLLQTSEEELASAIVKDYLDIRAIRKYLKEHGYKLFRCKEKTYKLSGRVILENLGNAEWKPWETVFPGYAIEFDPARPTLSDWWCDDFYARVGHIEDEEKIETEYRAVLPLLKNWEMPQDYKEFFQAIGNLWDAYESICISCKISQKVERPYYPQRVKDVPAFENKRYLFLWRECCRVMIDVFERTDLFKHSSPGAYFTTDDEKKLQIADQESGNQDFQLLLITFVECKLDIENIMILWREEYKLSTRGRRNLDSETPTPLEPSLVEAILRYRQLHSDEELRAAYRRFASHFPGKSWKDFLIENVLSEAMTSESGIYGIMTDKERLTETLDACIRRAKDAMENEPGLLQTRLEKAIEILSAADRMAVKFKCGYGEVRERVLRAYGMILEEHMLAYPDLCKDASVVALHLLNTAEIVYGQRDRRTAGCHRLKASVHSKLGEQVDASMHYMEAASIMNEVEGPDALWRGKDLRSAAVCYARIQEYDLALGALFRAREVFKHHPEAPSELEETYWSIAECYRAQGDKENEQKYRMLAAAIQATDEI